ncbi:MAG: DEAD/DEAH box helicase [Clostridia bacterium]|nr:DEAD/DEAH box helicase [Clostridia bacterium]
MPFQHLGLIPTLLSNVKNAGYSTPTPIQEATIPLVLEGCDVLGCAQTGTGKTAAFALPILQLLSRKPAQKDSGIHALILTPTRELAQQIYDCFVLYGRSLPVRSCVVYGGVGQQAQVDALHRGCDVLVACPGRLLDLMSQGIVTLDQVGIFVLDEADRMLDMGFIHDVRRVARQLPAVHQTLLFSATMPPEVEQLAMDLLNDPREVKVDPVSSPVKAIEQYMYYVDKANKKHLLASILKQDDVTNALVFSRTKYGCDRIVRDLKKAGLDAVAIHGDKSQGARTSALAKFKSGDCRVLVATDIAARGLDIEGLSHVINYDLPMESEAYIHRIGRTGRAGRGGTAISFCCIDEYKQLGQVEKLIGFRLPVRESDWPMEITTPTDPKTRAPHPARRPTDVNLRGEAVLPRTNRRFGAGKQQVPPRQTQKTEAGHPRLHKPVQRINHKKTGR